MSLILTLALAVTAPHVHKPDTTVLPEVMLVESPKTNPLLLPLDTKIISETQIEKSAESSLLPVLSNHIPGLFVTERGMAGYGVSDGAAGVVNIRGIGQGNKVLFMIDGQPHWAGVFGHSIGDAYNAVGIQRVEVVKGPSSLLYGSNAMGGSVNIITQKNYTEGFSGRARAMVGSYSTQKFDVSAGMHLGKFDASLAASLDRSNGTRKNSAFWSSTQLIQFSYRPDKHWRVGTTVDLLQTRAENPGTVSSPMNEMWTKMSRGTASVYVKDSYETASGGLQAFVNWGRHKIDDGYRAGQNPRDYLFNSTDYNMGFTLYQTFDLWQGNDLSAGVDFLHWGGHNWNESKADRNVRTSESRHCENEIGVYLMMQQDFWKDILSLNAGIRYQNGSQYGSEWIPQAGFIVRPYKGASVKFSFGKGFRAPNIRELYLYVPRNPHLKPEYMYNYDLEFRQTLLQGRLAFGVSVYFIDAKNLIEATFDKELGHMRNRNTGSTVNKGFEADFSFRINRLWSVGANYSYLHTSKPIMAAPKNRVNAFITYSPARFEFTAESENVMSMYKHTPTRTENFTRKTSYSLLNLQAAYNIPWKNHLRVFVKADNITDRHYDIVYGFPMPGITVMGGLELKF